MITGKQLRERGIITGPLEDENIQQVGIDLNLIQVHAIEGSGLIPAKGGTVLAERILVEPRRWKNSGVYGWKLSPGAYDITFAQGCVIPADHYCLIRQRSSLLRNGAVLHSSVFDPGYRTGRMGTVIILINPLVIEYNARVAQMYAHPCNTVENLYNGQWQEEVKFDNKILAIVDTSSTATTPTL